MIRIGLTGSIGCGKSTVAQVFKSMGIPVYQADNEARRLMETPAVVQIIAETFGKEFVSPKGEIDRAKLANLVFHDAENLSVLNHLIHPLVRGDFECWCELFHDKPYVLHEAAILFESGFYRLFNHIITVTADEAERISRVCRRDQVDESVVRSRMNNQMPDSEKVKRADYVIFNNETDMIIPQVLAIHHELLNNYI